jgi:hypothetical protein
MTQIFVCPTCGHKYKISDSGLNKRLTCSECNEVFTVPSPPNGAESSTRPAADLKQKGISRFLVKVVGEPSAVFERSIPGAISGILAGVLGAIVVGILSGEEVGEIVAAVFLGFVIGFGIGTVVGAILGVGGRHLGPVFRVGSRIGSLLGGALIGSIVVAIVGNRYWIPLGAGIGTVGPGIWMFLSGRMDAHLASHKFTPPLERPPADADQINRRISL